MIIVSFLDRRSKKRRGSMEWQAKPGEAEDSGLRSRHLQHVLHTPRNIEIVAR
jgi:hypothetical protein